MAGTVPPQDGFAGGMIDGLKITAVAAGAVAGMAGANAAVPGILGQPLHDPVVTGRIHDGPDFALTMALFLMLTRQDRPAWQAVIAPASGGMVPGLI
ncbi:MAG: hypothetical protein ACK5L9_08455 [Paracoccus sp. (in: a-proteobacteria)]